MRNGEGARMRIVETRGAGEWDRWADAWQVLHDACRPNHPFLEWTWSRGWLDWTVREGNVPILVRVESEGGEPIGLAAFQSSRLGGFSCLEGFAQAYCDYVDWLCLPGKEREVGDALLGWILRQRRRQNLIRVYNLFPGGVAHRTFARHCPEALDEHSVAPYVDTSGKYEAYLGGLKPRFLRDTRRRERKLAREVGDVEYFVVRQAGQIPEAVERVAQWAGGRLGAKREVHYFTKAGMCAHLTRFYERLHEAGLLHLSGLRAGGRPLALNVALDRGRGGLFSYTPAYDPAFAKYGVVRLLKMRHIQECFEQGRRVYDFCLGGEPYKMDFGPKIRQLYRCTLFGRNPGGLLLKFYLKRGKRFLKHGGRLRGALTGVERGGRRGEGGKTP